MIESITIEQFKTGDGKIFADKNEALQHDAEINAASSIARYRNGHMNGFTKRFKDSVCKHLIKFLKQQAVDNAEQAPGETTEVAAPLSPPDSTAQRQQLVAKISQSFNGDAKAIRSWLDEHDLPSVRTANSDQLKKIDEAFNQTRSIS